MDLFFILVMILATKAQAEKNKDDLLLDYEKNVNDVINELEELLMHKSKKQNGVDAILDSTGCQTYVTLMGIDYSMMGYNILYGNPMHSGIDPGYRLLIFDKSFDQKQYTDDCKYMVPDGVFVLSTEACTVSFSSTDCKTEEDYSNTLKAKVSFGFGGFGAEFSASASYQKTVHNINKMNYNYVYSNASCQYYYIELDTVHPPNLHATFVNFIKQLEKSDNATMYFQLFDNFGTHFLTKSHIGANYYHQFSQTESQREHTDSSSFDVSLQAKYSSIFSLSGDASLTEEQKQAAINFADHSTSSSITIGSVPPADGKAEGWATTVKESPLPIQITVEPIYDVFQQQYFIGLDVDYMKIRKNIMKYLPQYCTFIEQEKGIENVCNMSASESHTKLVQPTPLEENISESFNDGNANEKQNQRYLGSKQGCEMLNPNEKTFTGMSYATFGYNILYGYPMEPGLDPGFTRPIFNRTFSNQQYTPDCEYILPDGFQTVPALSCVTTFSADTCTNQRDFSSSLEAKASASFNGWGVSFSASASYNTAVEEMTKSKTVYIYSTATCNTFVSRLNPFSPPALHNSFVTYLKELEKNDTMEEYFKFFDTFGTHYVLEVYNGARYTHEYKQTEEQHEKSQKNSFSVSVQAELSSIISLSAGASLTKEQQDAAKNFTSLSSSTTITVGSLPTHGDSPEEWASAVKDSPMPMQLKLGSIEELFNEHFFNGTGVDFLRIKSLILKYQPEYCKMIENRRGLKNACNFPGGNCDLSGNGPHNIYCLRQWWLNAGWKPAGTVSPYLNESNVAMWNQMNAQDVRFTMGYILVALALAQYDSDKIYGAVYGTPFECPSTSTPPYKKNCLDFWWGNTECLSSGLKSPENNMAEWNSMSLDNLQGTMFSYRLKPLTVETYADCLGNKCPIGSQRPESLDCLEFWWTTSGCLLEGTKSPKNDQEFVKELFLKSSYEVLALFYNMTQNARYGEDNVEAYQECFGIKSLV